MSETNIGGPFWIPGRYYEVEHGPCRNLLSGKLLNTWDGELAFEDTFHVANGTKFPIDHRRVIRRENVHTAREIQPPAEAKQEEVGMPTLSFKQHVLSGHWAIEVDGVRQPFHFETKNQALETIAWLEAGGYEALFKARKEGK